MTSNDDEKYDSAVVYTAGYSSFYFIILLCTPEHNIISIKDIRIIGIKELSF